jgi:hypothetical protein
MRPLKCLLCNPVGNIQRPHFFSLDEVNNIVEQGYRHPAILTGCQMRFKLLPLSGVQLSVTIFIQ